MNALTVFVKSDHIKGVIYYKVGWVPLRDERTCCEHCTITCTVVYEGHVVRVDLGMA